MTKSKPRHTHSLEIGFHNKYDGLTFDFFVVLLLLEEKNSISSTPLSIINIALPELHVVFFRTFLCHHDHSLDFHHIADYFNFMSVVHFRCWLPTHKHTHIHPLS